MKFTFNNDNHLPASANGQQTKAKRGVKLSKREKEVLELVAQGLTAREIAEALFVSTDTVETHRRNIIQKLGARNIAEAVAKAVRRGFIK